LRACLPFSAGLRRLLHRRRSPLRRTCRRHARDKRSRRSRLFLLPRIPTIIPNEQQQIAKIITRSTKHNQYKTYDIGLKKVLSGRKYAKSAGCFFVSTIEI
jgi:hypothetical protein